MAEEIARLAALEALPQIDSNEIPIRAPRARPLRPAIYPLHPIIHSSPISSPTMSRRSSSAGSTVSSGNKSVRFPTVDTELESYRYTFSREHYDRSPIIPSCEDLEIPSCKNVNSGSWLTCLQKKAREAVLAGQAPPFISSVWNGDLNHPSPTSTMSSNGAPSLVHEDWSSSSESDDLLSPTTFTPPPSQIFGPSCNTQALSSEALCQSLMASPPRAFCWDAFRGRSDSYEDDADDDDDEEDSESTSKKRDRSPSDDEDDERPSRMCSLGGKFTRSELYSEVDCLGGF